MARLTARRIALATMILVIVTGGSTLLASTADSWWVGDLAVHFRLQYAAAALIALLVLGWARRWVWAGAALVVLAVNGIAAAPILGGGSVIRGAIAGAPLAISDSQGLAADPRGTGGRRTASPRQPLRIASINVLFHNTHYDDVAAFLRRERPDAAVLVEITPAWHAALDALRDEFPWQYYAESGHHHGGTLLLSRWPIEGMETVPMGPHADPTVVAVLSVRGRTLHLIGVHPSWPLGPAVSSERNRELIELAARARATPAPLIMAGDFNVTPFSPHFRDFIARSGLHWTAQGAGWQPTWPTFLPVGGIQIDHVFVSPGINVRSFARGSGIGSDHRPILVDLEW
ncbi:MAG TPA: endonuclease/exonuclease/phosphatase family protein [Steroidobacteraceae bacterium]|nr:endonuclease/exonuclease/phosphatase family protein [Steroidobacteraceae bacterium]